MCISFTIHHQDNVFAENQTMMKKEGLAVTSAGKLMCKHIIHVRARNTIDSWKSSIITCLQKTEKLGLSSIAFPALGTG